VATQPPIQKPVMPSPQTIARLPLPQGVNHSDLNQFIAAHSDVLQPYQPVQKEWNAYSPAFADGTSVTEAELKTLRLRIAQDFPRAHWLFVWGLHQTSVMLLGKSGSSIFLIDRQEDFLGRMSLLLFLSNELQSLSGRAEYKSVLKRFYKNANAKYFRRPLTDRPAKPAGLIKPEDNPQLPPASSQIRGSGIQEDSE
ncbi:MAG: hypothetical protein EBR09_12360, partial [Proteobacteria bacterium]|nr:hypothetical protein [Pseudomonadota bacterium]